MKREPRIQNKEVSVGRRRGGVLEVERGVGHHNILLRQMLKDFVPPAWVQRVVVVADAGFAANATLRLISDKHSTDVFASSLSERTGYGALQSFETRP